MVADGLALQISCAWGLLFWHFFNAPSSASVADYIKLRMIVDRLRTALFLGNFLCHLIGNSGLLLQLGALF